eukprot:3576512-Amphidinium_carterae.1
MQQQQTRQPVQVSRAQVHTASLVDARTLGKPKGFESWSEWYYKGLLKVVENMGGAKFGS